ncbi:hypothetical protein [Acinetobacter radioresistens]|uniref:hypothetical protein n=1 Tax=Acinetobacter radioresistens TaxID=40216 RepID=UPI0032649CC6
MNANNDEGKLISGDEAKKAWADGETVEFHYADTIWAELPSRAQLSIFDDEEIKSRVKPKTILINGIEVPAPFEPKINEFYYCISPFDACGYTRYRKEDNFGYGYDQFGAWRTEEEIKQVVAALRQVFGGAV